MASSALPVEQLRQYLRELPPGARALLIAELERAVLRGEEIPGGDMLLQEVRAAVRESGERAPRIGNPARLFFHPVEPFLTDAAPMRKTPGRMARTALEPIWTWIARDLAPAEAQGYMRRYRTRAGARRPIRPDALVDAFQDHVIDAMQGALAAANVDEKARRTARASRSGRRTRSTTCATCSRSSSARDTLALIESRLPGHIRNLADGPLENVKALLDSPLCRRAAALRPMRWSW